MKRTENDLHFDKAELPMPKDCYDALMNAARSVKEEKPMKRASFRAVLIAAIILIATTAAAFAAQQLGWIEFLFKQYDIAVPKTAEEALNASQSVVCEVGPLTFTYKQLLTDKRTLLSAADVRTTDGTEALLVDDSNFYEAVDADSDVVLEKYQLASGTTWVEAAKQLNLPLYGVRALAESDQAADAGEAMEAAMWNEDGSIVYLNQSMLDKHTVEDELPVTLYMAVHVYDPETDEVSINAYTERQTATLSAVPLITEKTYVPEGTAELQGLKLTGVHGEQYATGIYFTASFHAPAGMTKDEASDILDMLSFYDTEGNPLDTGMNLSVMVEADELPTVSMEVMSSLEAMPETLVITDGTTEITVR